MAGKIVADTLEHSTAGSVTTDYVVNGSAKAWGNYSNGRDVGTTIRDSFNTSSQTDIGTGRHDITLTNSMSNNDYAVATSGAYDETASGSAGYGTVATNDLTTSDFHQETGPYSTSPQPADIEVVLFTVHGDIA